jgi:hypothetical protein
MLYPLGIQGTIYPLGLHPGLITVVIVNFLPCLSVVSLAGGFQVETMAAATSLVSLAGEIQIETLAAEIAIVTLAGIVSIESLAAQLSIEGGEC